MSEAVRITMVPEAAEVVLGGQLSVALTVQHTGHSAAHYRLDVSGIPPDWYTLDRPYLALRPAASAQVHLTVHPPARPVTIAGRYTVTVQAHPYERVVERVTNELRARCVYVPRYPAGRLPVWLRRAPGRAVLFPLVLLLLLLVVAGGRALTRPATRSAVRPPAPAPTWTVARVPPTRPGATAQRFPSIGRFMLVHERRGQPYALVWQISGAAHVTLDGHPVAARGRLVLRAPLHSATYRLMASTGAHRATAALHLLVDGHTPDRRAVVLTTPDITTFTVRHRDRKLYAIWLVRNAVHVWLQGRLVAKSGDDLVPPGASWLRLVASNDVGSRQRLLHLARLVPPATPTRQRTLTAAAHRHRLLIARPTAAPRPTATPTPRPTETPTAPPTATLTPLPARTPAVRPATLSTPRPTVTSTPRPAVTPTPRPARTPTPMSFTIGSTTLPSAAATSTPTAVALTCCLTQP